MSRAVVTVAVAVAVLEAVVVVVWSVMRRSRSGASTTRRPSIGARGVGRKTVRTIRAPGTSPRMLRSSVSAASGGA